MNCRSGVSGPDKLGHVSRTALQQKCPQCWSFTEVTTKLICRANATVITAGPEGYSWDRRSAKVGTSRAAGQRRAV